MRKAGWMVALWFWCLITLGMGTGFALTVEVKANGQHELSLPRSEARAATYTVKVEPEEEAGRYVEWWLVAASPAGFWWFSLAGDWRYVQDFSGLQPTVRTALVEVPETQIPLGNLAEQAFVLGDFYLCLGVDFEVDGAISPGSLVYDCARVEVLPDESELACASIAGTWRGTLQGTDCREQEVFVNLFFVIEPSCEAIGPSGERLRLEKEGQRYRVNVEDFLDGRCGGAAFTLLPVSGDTLRVTADFGEGGTLEGSLLREE